MVDDQCQAAVHDYRSMKQCEKRAKFDARVITPHYVNDDKEPFTVRLCGIHNRVTEAGGSLSIVTGKQSSHWQGGPETRNVVGIKTDINQRKEEAERASARAQRAYGDIDICARRIGQVLVKHPNTLDSLDAIADHDLAEVIQRYRDALVAYEQAREESRKAHTAVEAGP